MAAAMGFVMALTACGSGPPPLAPTTNLNSAAQSNAQHLPRVKISKAAAQQVVNADWYIPASVTTKAATGIVAWALFHSHNPAYSTPFQTIVVGISQSGAIVWSATILTNAQSTIAYVKTSDGGNMTITQVKTSIAKSGTADAVFGGYLSRDTGGGGPSGPGGLGGGPQPNGARFQAHDSVLGCATAVTAYITAVAAMLVASGGAALPLLIAGGALLAASMGLIDQCQFLLNNLPNYPGGVSCVIDGIPIDCSQLNFLY